MLPESMAPPLAFFDEFKAFMEERNLRVRRIYEPPFVDSETGEKYPAYWQVMVEKGEKHGDLFYAYCLEMHDSQIASGWRDGWALASNMVILGWHSLDKSPLTGGKEMASVVSGSVTIGGTVFGAVEADVKLDDGTSWHYAGYYADCGAGVGVCNSPSGDFPGESHMAGSCFMSVIQVPGGFGVSFDDFHGHIGTLGGVFEGAIIELGVGGGTWTQVSEGEEPDAIESGDSLVVEMHHEFVGSEDEDSSK